MKFYMNAFLFFILVASYLVIPNLAFAAPLNSSGLYISPTNPIVTFTQVTYNVANISNLGGVPPYTFSWYYGFSTSCSSNTNLIKTGSNSLSYGIVSYKRENEYLCFKVQDSTGNYTYANPDNITVLSGTAIISPSSPTVVANQTLTLSVANVSNVDTTYMWYSSLYNSCTYNPSSMQLISSGSNSISYKFSANLPPGGWTSYFICFKIANASNPNNYVWAPIDDIRVVSPQSTTTQTTLSSSTSSLSTTSTPTTSLSTIAPNSFTELTPNQTITNGSISAKFMNLANGQALFNVYNSNGLISQVTLASGASTTLSSGSSTITLYLNSSSQGTYSYQKYAWVRLSVRTSTTTTVSVTIPSTFNISVGQNATLGLWKVQLVNVLGQSSSAFINFYYNNNFVTSANIVSGSTDQINSNLNILSIKLEGVYVGYYAYQKSAIFILNSSGRANQTSSTSITTTIPSNITTNSVSSTLSTIPTTIYPTTIVTTTISVGTSNSTSTLITTVPTSSSLASTTVVQQQASNNGGIGGGFVQKIVAFFKNLFGWK